RSLGDEYTANGIGSSSITWLYDSMPDLKNLRSLDQRFQLILISAGWMHMPPDEHERAMRIISEVLAPGGLLVITLRHGPDEENRFYPVNAHEVIRMAQGRALVSKRRTRTSDLNRKEFQWDTLVFTLPDDGTGSLPLLRHII